MLNMTDVRTLEEVEAVAEKEELDVWDTCYGTVIEACPGGIKILLSSGETVFAYNYQSLLPETTVMCSLRRDATPEKGRFLREVIIDSSVYDWVA